MTMTQKQRPIRLTEAVNPNPQPDHGTTESGVDALAPSNPSTDWSHTVERLTALPNQANEWVMQYRSQITVVAALVAAVIVLKLALALLEAINGIPLMQPMLELIGLGYVGGFVVQHLLTAERRQELNQTLQTWKTQVLGH
ncbi:hypothetical protein GFS31_40460 (plasmid) [Leptolyngbya sp. BL0902]|uniref:CAAD domain-containing protein n=1 Tax=Leptolyngbya sp. BL0902 TaxID=1115757 RepID=UPI0018E8DF6D|nr:CAAD domain-containing protein [Leptolyngbya sp. BL0902]QQE67333.1 hypothetical protein GFS31_40460 [Leptolyngbya sp. BL0902]